MRDGVLLAEKSPKELMKSQLCNSLEDAFLKLSEKQEKEKKEEEKEEVRVKAYHVLSCLTNLVAFLNLRRRRRRNKMRWGTSSKNINSQISKSLGKEKEGKTEGWIYE